MGTILNFTSPLSIADLEEAVVQSVPALAGRILQTKKQTATDGSMEFTDTLSAGEQTSASSALAGASQPVRPVPFSISKYRQTPNATPITISFPLPTTSTAEGFVKVKAVSGNAMAVWYFHFSVKRGAGNPVFVNGSPQTVFPVEKDAALSAANAALTAPAGSAMVLTLTGIAGMVNWDVKADGELFNP